MNNKEINISKQLKIHSLLKSISTNFISLFVPLIILQQIGYQMAMIYVAILHLSLVVMLFSSSKLIKNKPMVAISLHVIFSIASYVTIAAFDLNLFIIIFNAICSGISQALYTSPMYAIISSNSNKNNKMFSLHQVYSLLGSILIILFNGVILNENKSFSIWLTCLVSLAIYVIGLIPLFIIRKEIKFESKECISFKKLVEQTKEYSAFHILFGLQHLVVNTIIPLYLYINNLSLQTIAYIVILVNIAKIVTTIFANNLYKKGMSFTSILIGSILFIIPCLILLVSDNKILAYILTVLLNLSFPLFFIPNCNSYGEKTRESAYSAMILREICVHMFRPIVLLPFIFIENLSILIYLAIPFTIFLLILAHPLFKNSALDESNII